MKKTALVIMAAGIGSRFGKGIKQLAKVGPSGEIIMDYSIHDALEAGFNKVVFIIRKDIEEEFREIIGNRIEKITEVEYVFQDLKDLPEGFTCPADRTKPWGTGQAVLAAKKAIAEPFVVINADDYYGKEGFRKIHSYLEDLAKKDAKYDYCMAGFLLGNTLSDNGTVTRGVCKTDENNMLVTVNETFEIAKKDDKAIGYDENKNEKIMDLDTPIHQANYGESSVSYDNGDYISKKIVDVKRGNDKLIIVTREDE